MACPLFDKLKCEYEGRPFSPLPFMAALKYFSKPGQQVVDAKALVNQECYATMKEKWGTKPKLFALSVSEEG